MKVFIDLGSYKGHVLEMALKRYKNFDKFYAFEPFSCHFKILKRKFSSEKKIILFNFAADITSQVGAKLYFMKNSDQGHSLCAEKVNCDKNSFELTATIDFSKFILDNFSPDDYIVLKVNIEGKEYDIFDKMIKDGTIKYINKIFCEWHRAKINISYLRHKQLVKMLNNLGFDISEYNLVNEFKKIRSLGISLPYLLYYAKRILQIM